MVCRILGEVIPPDFRWNILKDLNLKSIGMSPLIEAFLGSTVDRVRFGHISSFGQTLMAGFRMADRLRLR